METREVKLSEISNIYKGIYAVPEERKKPKTLQGRTVKTVINYKEILQYEDGLRTNTINMEAIKNAQMVYLNLEKKFKDSSIKSGDIVIPINNVTCGPLFIKYDKTEDFNNLIYHNKLIIIRPNEEQVVPEFLFTILNTSNIKDYLLKNSWEEKKQKYRLTCKVVSNIKINIPILQEQISMVQKLEEANKIKREIIQSAIIND